MNLCGRAPHSLTRGARSGARGAGFRDLLCHDHETPRRRGGGREGWGGSMLKAGGSGRLWVRGQSCKLTGCVKVNHGESFPPEASGPRARGKDCHVRWVAFAARPAQPAVPEARGETPPGRGRVHHPARRPGGHRPRARPAQLGRAEAGLRPATPSPKATPWTSCTGSSRVSPAPTPRDGRRPARTRSGSTSTIASWRCSRPEPWSNKPARWPRTCARNSSCSARPRLRPWFSWPACGITRRPTPRRRTG